MQHELEYRGRAFCCAAFHGIVKRRRANTSRKRAVVTQQVSRTPWYESTRGIYPRLAELPHTSIVPAKKKESWVISKGSGTGGKKNNNDVEMSQWCPRRIAFV